MPYFLFILFSVVLADAAEEGTSRMNLPEIRLDNVVVTGTRTPKMLKEGPVKTEVVGEDEIRTNRYRDAAEALRDLPGVTLVESTGKEGQSALIQGMGAEHVLVLVDGAPVLQNSSSGVDLTQIPAADIQRIEVVKGGASALYGGQAMGGVINIITKPVDERFRYELELMHDQSLEDAAGAQPPLGLAKIHLRGQASGNLYKLNLHRRAGASVDHDLRSLTRDSADFEKWGAGFLLERPLNDRHRISVDLGYNREQTRTYAARLQPNSQYTPVWNDGDVRRQRAKLGYVGHLSEDQTLQLYVLSERVDDQLSLEDDPSTAQVENLKTSNLRRERLEAQYDLSFWTNHVTTWGAVAERNSLSQATETPVGGTLVRNVEVDAKSTRTLESYIQDDWIFDRAELVTGLRASHDLDFGFHADPKVNLMLNPAWSENFQSIFRLSAGSGYRIPNLKERFYVLDHRSWAGYVVYGNQDLRPEESLNLQAGVELSAERSWSSHANLFYNQVRGLITTQEISNGTNERVFRFENIGEAQIYGLELNGSLQIQKRGKISPSWTFTKAQDRGTGLIVPNRPFYTAQIQFQYMLKPETTDASATFRYIGDSYGNLENTEKYSGYSVFDLRLNHRLNRSTQVFMGIRNLFDVKREARVDAPGIQFDQRPELGRMVFFGLSMEG